VATCEELVGKRAKRHKAHRSQQEGKYARECFEFGAQAQRRWTWRPKGDFEQRPNETSANKPSGANRKTHWFTYKNMEKAGKGLLQAVDQRKAKNV